MRIATTHRNADFDGLASLIGATILYPGTIPVLPKHVNPNVKGFVSLHKDVFSFRLPDEIDPDAVTSLVVVDVDAWRRLEGLQKLQEKGDLEILLWDHHPRRGDIRASWECREEIGATITLMLREIKRQGKSITPIQATLFLMGIYEDTGSLTFPNTTAEDAYAVGYLLDHNADLAIVGTILRPAYGLGQKEIFTRMIKTAERTRIDEYTISINKLAITGHVEGLAMVVRMYMDVLNVDAAFGIFEHEDRGRCIVIGRSRVEGIDVGWIMNRLGGGGHPGAGSALLKKVNPDAVAQMINELIRGNQQTSVRIGDLMSFPVQTISPDMTMAEAKELLQAKGVSGFPVVDPAGKVVGILSRRDVRKIRRDSQYRAPVKSFMQTQVKTITPDKSPIQVARLMAKHDIGRLPVVEDGTLIGIVTRSDTMLYFYDLLPD